MPNAFFCQWINAKFPESVLYVQNIDRCTSLGAPFRLRPWDATLKALALIWHCLEITFCKQYLGASVYDVIRAFEKASGVKIPVEVSGRRIGDIPATYAKGTLAEEELGWKAEKTLDQMCKLVPNK